MKNTGITGLNLGICIAGFVIAIRSGEQLDVLFMMCLAGCKVPNVCMFKMHWIRLPGGGGVM